jgi:hypothetical protein
MLARKAMLVAGGIGVAALAARLRRKKAVADLKSRHD